MSELIHLTEKNFSIMGKDSKLQGSFLFNGNTHLQAIVDGEIIMEKDTCLSIDPAAQFTGKITGSKVDIHGQFDGILSATSTITIFPSAVLKGEINGKDIVIYPGATINADIHTLD